MLGQWNPLHPKHLVTDTDTYFHFVLVYMWRQQQWWLLEVGDTLDKWCMFTHIYMHLEI